MQSTRRLAMSLSPRSLWPHYHLTYFNFRGRGEAIRQLLILGGQPFEEDLVKMKDWRANNRSCQKPIKYLRLPMLEIDGVQLPQSRAILGHLGEKYGMAGSCPLERVQIRALADQVEEFTWSILPYIMRQVGVITATQQEAEEAFSIAWPKYGSHYLPLFERAIERNEKQSGYLVGNGLSYADIYMADFMSGYDWKYPGSLDKYPKIRAHYKMVNSNPVIQRRISERPETMSIL